MDVADGTEVDGPRLETIHALGARLLGWQQDGDAVVVAYRQTRAQGEPAGQAIGSLSWQTDYAVAPIGAYPEVVAVSPDGGSSALVVSPAGANRIDVARDLLDRFGGPPPSLPSRLLDWFGTRTEEIVVAIVGLVAAIYGIRVVGGACAPDSSVGTANRCGPRSSTEAVA